MANPIKDFLSRIGQKKLPLENDKMGNFNLPVLSDSPIARFRSFIMRLIDNKINSSLKHKFAKKEIDSLPPQNPNSSERVVHAPKERMVIPEPFSQKVANIKALAKRTITGIREGSFGRLINASKNIDGKVAPSVTPRIHNNEEKKSNNRKTTEVESGNIDISGIGSIKDLTKRTITGIREGFNGVLTRVSKAARIIEGNGKLVNPNNPNNINSTLVIDDDGR